MNERLGRPNRLLALAILAFASTGTTAIAQHHSHVGRTHSPSSAKPVLAGQDAFGAIQEVVGLLEADPSTDWSKVNIGALRDHLVDMHEVTLNAIALPRALPDGLEMIVTGQGRTREAIQRMVPAHANELRSLGWDAKTESRADGITLIVTSADATQSLKIKALGFFGIMVQGGHHQQHHLEIARGNFKH